MDRPTPQLVRRLATAAKARPVALGRYDVVGLLGQGGMGTVYAAVDRERGTRVALKTVSVDGADGILQLKREFRTVADVHHANLAPVYELGCEDDVWFFTMRRVDGVRLRGWLRGQDYVSADASQVSLPLTRSLPGTATDLEQERDWETLESGGRTRRRDIEPSLPARSFEEIRRAMSELVLGITALHDAGLRHGDIKPSNVLVEADGRIVVVDFGLAQPVGRNRWEARSDVSGGTPPYMSPEQLGGGPSSASWDWYALGVVLYEALTGFRPFRGWSVLDLYLKKLNHTPAAPHELLPDVPTDLSELCLALIRPEPAHRPDGETLLRLFAGQTDHPSSERPLRSAFVGRERELRLLEHAYSQVRRGGRVVAQVRGPSGIGKTATASNFLDGIEDLDHALVFRGRCYERESLPYKAFDGIVDALSTWLRGLDTASLGAVVPEWIAELAQLFPVLESVIGVARRVREAALPTDPAERRRRALVALGDLLGAASRRRPVVLYVDDLQWADADSVALLLVILRGSSDAHLLLVLSFRPADASKNPALADYFDFSRRLDASALIDIELDVLSREEAESLATHILEAGGDRGPSGPATLAREAGRVPFFIEELARFTAAHPEARFEELSLEEVIGERVRSLSPERRTLVELVAVSDSPIALSVLADAAGPGEDVLPALLALRSACLVRLTGAGAEDLVSTHHDRIRESIIATLSADALARHHLALGRLIAARHRGNRAGPWAFDIVRHLNAAERDRLGGGERLEAARWNLAAGRRATDAAAFPLASRCFEAGVALLPAAAWETDYELTLGLRTGAAETAYLCGAWAATQTHVESVKANGRTVLDQLVAWEVEIDSLVGRQDYLGAVKTAAAACQLLDVHIPETPTPAEVGAAIQKAMVALAPLGPEGLERLEDVSDPAAAAATRLQVRVAPAAFFARPALLPVLACNLVESSVRVGLSSATPYALAIYGVVLNTLGMQPEAHAWGQVALRLIDRWNDRKLEACTRYAVWSLVCNFMQPLSSTLDELLAVFEIGKRTGDLEYGAYAAHAYVHNALYAARPLGPLLREAVALGEEMRGLGQMNASHVHAPIEQVLRSLVGESEDAGRLVGPSFDAAEAIVQAEQMGSRSGLFLIRFLVGYLHFHFGDIAEASRELEKARALTDASASTWHVPMFHQIAALAACGAMAATPEADRAGLMRRIDESLTELQKLAAHAPTNFAHRVAFIEAERLRLRGDLPAALSRFEEGVALAEAGGWLSDVGLGHELAARCHSDAEGERRHLAQAADAYTAWGAIEKVRRLQDRLG